MNRRSVPVTSPFSAAALPAAPIASAADDHSTAVLRLLNEVAQSIGHSQTTEVAFSSWIEAARVLIPFAHATALVVQSDAAQPGAVRRIYSTVPLAYPVGGWKDLGRSDWAETVLVRRLPLVASGEEELAHFFPDHEQLRGLGTETLVNIPVIACDRAIGAFAFMCSQRLPTEFVTKEMKLLAALATPLFLIPG